MDQRATTEAELYERLFPGRPLPYWLGEALRAPVRDIPTVEDWQREQGMIGVPTEEQSSREVGQGALDYLAMAHGLANLFKAGGAGAQELMGKQRGVETFGKEMMDTSRRAQPQKWRETERENWQHTRTPDDPGSSIATSGREGYERGALPPQRDLVLPTDAPRPRDVVQGGGVTYKRRGDPTLTFENGYTIGEPVVLPSGTAQYVVTEGPGGYRIGLKYGDRLMPVTEVHSIGEALAKARQLQNRLALAAKDPELPGVASGSEIWDPRTTRLPWERGPSRWQEEYQPPPRSGRWTGGYGERLNQ